MAAEPGSRWPRAARIARGNGLGYVICGLLTLVGAFPEPSLDMLLGAALITAGLIERRQAAHLAEGIAGAATNLSHNELALGSAIVGYALLRMTVLPSPSFSDPELVNALGTAGADVEEMARAMAQVVYGAVAVIAVLYQGGMALYFRRYGTKHGGH
jgi:hypothetical protein